MPVSGRKQLEVILTYQDRLSGTAPRTVQALRSVESQAKRSTSAVEKLNKVMGGALGGKRVGGGAGPPDYLKPLQRGAGLTRQIAAEAARGLKIETQQARLLREQTKLRGDGARLAREEARAVESLARSQRAGLNTELADVRLQRERLRLQRDADRHGARRRGPWRERIENFNTGVRTARNVRDVAGATVDTVRGFTDPALKEMRSEQRFKMMGFSPEENRMAFGAVDRTVAEVKGVRRGDVIESLTGLINTFGDVDEAVQFLPITARYRANMEAMYGDIFSPEQVTRQISNSFKAMEILGFDRPTGPRGRDGKPTFSETDRARMENRFQLVARATTATGGEINPDEFRQFAKYSRLGGLGLTEEGLTSMLPLVGQLGGATTGQSLMRVYSALSGGVMKKEHKKEWERLGLRDPKTGRIALADKFRTHPLAAADELAGVLSSKAGVDTKDFNSVNAQLVKMFGNQNALGLVAQMINFQAGIGKEIDKNARAFDINRNYKEIFESGNPLGQLLDASVTETNARAAAGRPVAELGGTIAEKLTRAIDYVRSTSGDSSAFSVATIGVLSLGKAAAEAADGVGLLGKITGGAGGEGGASGGGGWFGTGYGTGDIFAGGWTLGKGLQWGARAGLSALSRFGLPGLIAAGGVGSIYALDSQHEYETGKRRKAESDAGLTFDEVKRRREQSGGRLPDDVARDVASRAFPGIDRRGLLNEFDVKPPAASAGYPGMTVRPPYDPAAVMAGGFARRAPELGLPEVMREWIRDTLGRVQSGQMAQSVADAQLGVAKKAFPDVFAQASAEVSAALGKVPEPATQTGKALSDLLGPARGLPASLSYLGGSFDALAARVNSLEFRPPSITLPPAEGSTGAGKGKTGNRIIDSYNPLKPFGGFRARGGRVRRGYTYGVGEEGFEWFTPGADGFITPHHELQGAASHRGNVVFPARLSRRSPGDWLESAEAIQTATGGGSGPQSRTASGSDLLNPLPPQSAVGSVVQRDGLVSAHRGNVIFPAALSRRSPGDWLKSAGAARAAADRWRRAPADELRRALPRLPRDLPASPAEWREAAGSVRERVERARRAPAEELGRALPGAARWLRTVEAVRGMVGRGGRDGERSDAAEVIGGGRPRRAGADELTPPPTGPSALPALPGDWMDAAGATRPRFARERRAGADDLTPTPGLPGDSPAPRVPAGRAEASEGAGPVDYSQFAPGRSGGGGREIIVNVGGVHVTGGADARATGAAVAEEVERQVREALARIAALESDLYDPRFIANMTARELNWQRERA